MLSQMLFSVYFVVNNSPPLLGLLCEGSVRLRTIARQTLIVHELVALLGLIAILLCVLLRKLLDVGVVESLGLRPELLLSVEIVL